MKRTSRISGVTLVSYDYRFLLTTIPRYLPWVDELLVGVDRDRLTWSGETFAVPETFFDDLMRLDESPPKIRIVSRSFYSPTRSPMENDVAERNALSLEVPEGNWIVSIDADEYLLNPDQFFHYLRNCPAEESACLEGRWITVFKDLGDSMLVIAAKPDGSLERFPIATRQRGSFVTSRRTNGPAVPSPAIALHYSWGRQPEELLQKLLNWSHTRDFDVRKYFDFWRTVDEKNYSTFRDFHPIWPDTWSKLVRVSKQDLDSWESWKLYQEVRPGILQRAWRKALRHWHGRRT